MARGFLSGFVVGAAVSVCAAAIVSHVAGPPAPPEVGIDVPAAGVAPSGPADTATQVPGEGDGDPLQPTTPVVGAPDATPDAAVADETMRPADRPDAGSTASGVEPPAADARPGGVAVDGVAPVVPNPQGDAPVAPETEAMIPTRPPLPEGADSAGSQPGPGGDAGLQMPDADVTDAPVAPGAEAGVTSLSQTPSSPGAPDQPDGPALPFDSAPRPETQADGPPDAPDLPPSRQIADAPAIRDAADRAGRSGAPGFGQAPEAEDMPQGSDLADDGSADPGEETRNGSAGLPQAGSTGDTVVAPSVGTPATSLLDRDTGGAGAGIPDDGQADETAGADAVEQDSALRRNAVPFEIPEDRPLMSIILMDTGQDPDDSPVGLPALGSFPYPLSFAVDTSLPDAAERAERYRAAGHEVLALVNLPQNLTAADTEVSLTASLAQLPKAAAVLEGPGSGLQGSAEMSRQVSAILADTGHGIVWQPNGLDSAQRMANRAGVESRTVFRDIDSGDETPLAIRRVLDRAAFRAGQEGSVIVVGRLRPDTISALLVWGLQDRERRVAVAPASAVLLSEEGDS